MSYKITRDGLGIITIPTITVPKPTLWQTLSTGIAKVQTGIQNAQPVIQQSKSLLDIFRATKKTITAPTATQANTADINHPSVNTGMSTGMKIALGVAATALAAGIVYKVSGKKKGLGMVESTATNSLGYLNTAKTKARRIKQTKAAFYHMDEAGTTFTKNKNGKRKKKSKK